LLQDGTYVEPEADTSKHKKFRINFFAETNDPIPNQRCHRERKNTPARKKKEKEKEKENKVGLIVSFTPTDITVMNLP
jgi:hypothetical protein